MTAKQLNQFTARCLMILKTAQTDGNSKTVRVVIDALAKAHGVR